jgi:hypothetical protein
MRRLLAALKSSVVRLRSLAKSIAAHHQGAYLNRVLPVLKKPAGLRYF